MSEWTDIIDGIVDHIQLLKELGERTVVIDPAALRALAAPVAVAPVAVVPAVESSGEADRRGAGDGVPDDTREKRQAALDALRERMEACIRCGLHETRGRLAPGTGNPLNPDILFLTDLPEAADRESGVLFSGPAGAFLDKVLAAMGYSREAVFICAVCNCRPPANRSLDPGEMNACSVYARDQIKIVRPRVIVALGSPALRGLFQDRQTITADTQGKWMQYEGIPLMPTYHPERILRFGDSAQTPKRQLWNAMKLVLERLGRTPPKPAK